MFKPSKYKQIIMKKRMNIIWVLLFSGLSLLQAQTLEDGLTMITNENYPEARRIFGELMKANPGSPEPYFYTGETYFLYNILDTAEYYFNLGLENVSKRDQGLLYVGLGKIQYANHKKKEARDNFERAEKANRRNNDWRIPFEIGRVYLEDEDRDLEMAVLKLEEAKDLARQRPEPFIKLGDAYMAKYEGGKAANQYDYVLNNLNIELPEIYMKKALLFKRSRTNDLAIENLKKAIEIDPEYSPAYRELIDIYQEEKKYDKVTPLLETYTNLVADDIEAKVRFVGFMFRQARDFDRTIEEANKVLEIEPDNYRMHRWKGYALVEKEQYAEGLASLKKFFENIGEDRTYFTDFDYYAKAAAAMGEYEEAEEKYLKALEFDNINRGDVYEKIAKMYFDAKKYEKAANAYRVKMEESDAVSTDYFYLGFSLFSIGEYSDADSSFAIVTEVLPEWLPGYVFRAKCNELLDPELDSLLAMPHHQKVIELAKDQPKRYGVDLINAYKYLGFVAFKNDELEDAKENFTELYQIALLDKEKFEETLKETYKNLGYIYFQSDEKEDKEKAVEYYSKLIELDPENEDALNALELLSQG